MRHYSPGVRDINKWSEKMRAPMIQVYGEDYFKKTWSSWIDGVLRLYEKQNGDVCKQVLSKIKCPTLIIHGAKDAMVLPEHPTYLKQNIADSKFASLWIWKKIIVILRYYFVFLWLILYFFAECISSRRAHIIFTYGTPTSSIVWLRISSLASRKCDNLLIYVYI